MNPLEARKRLLIAESEINRIQLAEEWQAMAGGARALTQRANSIRVLVVAGSSLIYGLMFSRRTRSAPAGRKRPWWQILLKGALLAGSLWSQFGPRPKSH
jgi:hypothetical protein